MCALHTPQDAFEIRFAHVPEDNDLYRSGYYGADDYPREGPYGDDESSNQSAYSSDEGTAAKEQRLRELQEQVVFGCLNCIITFYCLLINLFYSSCDV